MKISEALSWMKSHWTRLKAARCSIWQAQVLYLFTMIYCLFAYWCFLCLTPLPLCSIPNDANKLWIILLLLPAATALPVLPTAGVTWPSVNLLFLLLFFGFVAGGKKKNQSFIQRASFTDGRPRSNSSSNCAWCNSINDPHESPGRLWMGVLVLSLKEKRCRSI